MQPHFRPLVGVAVVDISHVIAGPFATLHLALLGAEVTKIESLEGDIMRGSPRGPKPYVALNAPKRELRLDLRDGAVRERVLAMARGADVLVDNLRPGSLDKLGLGWAAVHAVNPRLVYCSISGFGRDAGGRPAYDHVVQAATGMTLATGGAGEPPAKIAFPLIDTATGLLAAYAILAGLRERDRTGRGVLLDVSMAGAALQLMYPIACEAMTDGTAPARLGNQASSGSPGGDVFATRDGGWIATAANTPVQLSRLLDVLDLAHLARDPELFGPADAPGAGTGFARARNLDAVKVRLRARFADRDSATLEAELLDAGVPAARVLSLPDYARAAEAAGTLTPVVLERDGVTVRSPGLGFRVVEGG